MINKRNLNLIIKEFNIFTKKIFYFYLNKRNVNFSI